MPNDSDFAASSNPRWEQIDRLLQSALERAPENRHSYLTEACAGDASLLHEVLSLLASHEEAGDFLEDAAVSVESRYPGETLAGRQLGPYELLSLLGSGGMGEVYHARDTRLHRHVAVKILPQRLSRNPDLRQRLMREARAVSSLNHPHIRTLYDIGHHDGVDYLVMEYLEGETLAVRLTRGPLSLEESLRYGIQLADALSAAHREGITHRDVKPGNIMLVKSGVKLLDFGLAKLSTFRGQKGDNASDRGNDAGTAAGTLVGTVQYMSPEQLEGADADARADIFAFGAVLYEMISGRKAFSGKSQASLIAAILSASPPALSADLPSASDAVAHLIERCLAKHPEERWQSALDLKHQLQWVAAGLSKAESGTSTLVSPRRSAGRLAWGVLAVGLAVGLSLGALRLRTAENATAGKAFQFQLRAPAGTEFGNPLMGAPAVSPDGSWVLFSATLDGRTAWHLKSLDSTEPPRLLAGTENGYHPFWSPDSRSVGFFEGGHLKIVAIAGGPPTTLCDLPEPTGNQGKGGAWNRNGDIVFAMPRAAPLYRVSQNGGECRQLTTLAEGEESHRWPSFLPDGRHFLYFSRGDENAIYIGSLDSPRRTPVLQGVTTNAVYASGHLLFVDDENLMAQKLDSDDFEKVGEPFRIANPVAFTTAINRGLFNVSDAGVLVFYPGAGANLRQILEYDRSGNLLREVGPPAAYDSIRLSPEGTTLLVGSSPSSPRLRVLDLSTGQQSVFNPDMNVTSAQSPVWSATNQVFFAAQSCRPLCAFAIYEATPGTVVERVSDKDYGLLPLDASRDGKYLLVLALPQRRPGLRGLFWTAELTPEPTLHKVPAKAYVEREGRLSPDGSMLAYSSDESGAFEVSVRTFPNAESKVVISRGGGRNPVWRGDSNEVVFLSGDRFLTSVTLKNSNSGISIEKTERLFQLPGTQLSGGVGTRPFWDMTPDGRTFFVAEDRERQPPTVITDWTAGVNR